MTFDSGRWRTGALGACLTGALITLASCQGQPVPHQGAVAIEEEARKKIEVNLALEADGSVLWNKQPVSWEEFLNRLAVASSGDPEVLLIIDGIAQAATPGAKRQFFSDIQSVSGSHNIVVAGGG